MQKRNTKQLLTLCLAAALLLGLPMAALADEVQVTTITIGGVGTPVAGFAPVDISTADIILTSDPAGTVVIASGTPSTLRWTENDGAPVVGNFAWGKTYKLAIPVATQNPPGDTENTYLFASAVTVTSETLGTGVFTPANATNNDGATVVFTYEIPPEPVPSPGTTDEPQSSPTPEPVVGVPSTGENGSGMTLMIAMSLVIAAPILIAVLYARERRAAK